MKQVKLSIIILLAMLIAVPCLAQGPPAVPKIIEYSGKLSKPNGSPYPTGIYDINFQICTEESCTTPFWTEIHTVEISAKNKKDIDGATSYEAMYSVLLGESTPLNFAFDQVLYLMITESSLGHSKVEQFASVPSALSAELAVKVYDSNEGIYSNLQDITINEAHNSDTVDGKHYSDIAQEIDDDVAVHAGLTNTHGVIGEIVGTENDQTLTNKHISGEQIDSGKINNARLWMGEGNGLNADMLDGKHASYFAPAHSHPYASISHSHPEYVYVNDHRAMCCAFHRSGADDWINSCYPPGTPTSVCERIFNEHCGGCTSWAAVNVNPDDSTGNYWQCVTGTACP